MVRFKHRYLVVNFLYPLAAPDKSPKALSSSGGGTVAGGQTALPAAVQFYQPTPDALTPAVLVKMIRDSVAEHFGDYGAAMVAGGLKGKQAPPSRFALVSAGPDFPPAPVPQG